jgi:electron transfer flavoprotein-quinone oxidoreductase|tara:strand:+ start:448 stop:1734 length:1287 start_codon:yes stop_codon:yes gene_type:complete
MSTDYDVIIVGAGPAGSAAAYSLAKNGHQVLILERGKEPGSKNVYGGRIYPYSLSRLIPNFADDAPIERNVTKESIMFMNEKSSFQTNFSSDESVNHGFTAFRSKFDSWFANKAIEAGAELFPEIKVDDVVFDDKKSIIGIKSGDDEITSKLVIAADGATSIIAKKAGLRSQFNSEHFSVGVKEVIELPTNVINDRFCISNDNGAALVCVGSPTNYLRGGAFIYTNKSSISIGLVVKGTDLIDNKIQVSSLLNNFKNHPDISCIVKEGKVVEYSAHLVPEAGFNMLPKLYGNGILVCGDAAGMLLNNGYTFRGVDLAISSGIAAAEAFITANDKEDFSNSSLSIYENLLYEHNVLTDIKKFKKGPKYMENQRLYSDYPKLICNIFENLYNIDGNSQKLVREIIRGSIKNNKVSTLNLILDSIKGSNAL